MAQIQIENILKRKISALLQSLTIAVYNIQVGTKKPNLLISIDPFCE